MIRSLKVSFIFLISFLSFHVSAQECDLRCQMESMLGSKPENKSSTPSRPSERRYSSSKPLIHDVKEVQDFLDQITLYFVGEEFIKVGSVRGDLNSFNISNIKMEADGESLVEIKQISFSDDDRLGWVNKRPSSLEDYISYDYYAEFFENGGLYANSEFRIEGINLSRDIAEELYYEVPYLRNLGLTDNINLSLTQTSDYKDVEGELLLDMNDQAKVSIKIEQPKIILEESLEFIKEAFQLLSYAQYEGSCESDYNNLLNEYGMTSDDYPMPAFAFEYFGCIFSGLEYIDDDVYLSFFESMEGNSTFYATGKFSYDVSWSTEVWNAASIASGGALDVGLLTAKGFLANKMSKFELVSLLDGVFGIPYEYKGLFDDLVYEYYSDFYNEAKSFVSYPRGIGISVEILNPIDPNVLENLEDNPMLFFNLLNNIRFDIYANPSI